MLNLFTTFFSFLLLVPENVTAVPDSPSSFIATVVPAGDTSSLDHYVVQIKEDTTKTCKATQAKLSCTITDLSAATQYTVQVKACLVDGSGVSPCSPVKVGGKGWTKPTSKHLMIIR